MLTRLAVEWASTLVGTRLEELRQQSSDRFRLSFASEGFECSLVVCLDSRRPWMAEATRRFEGPLWSPHPEVAAAAHALVGRRVERIDKAPPDRSIRIELGDGRGIVFDLAPQTANLIVLGAGGTIEGVLRPTRSSGERLTPGHPWSARAVPITKLDPFSMSADAIDRAATADASLDEPPEHWLRRRFIGLGAIGAALVVSARLATGQPLGALLRARLDSILDGSAEVVVEGPEDGSNASLQLLPWRPDSPAPGRRWLTRDRAGATAGFYFETLDAEDRVHARIAALGRILRREVARTRKAELKVRDELTAFEDPDKHRRMGEALLAGLTMARRAPDSVRVPDPYDPLGAEIVIPAPPDRSLTDVADDLFRRQRRARRGLASAGARADALTRRIARLEALIASHGAVADELGAETLEAAMRAEGLPVGLVAPTRAGRATARAVAPRLEGVRMITSADGWTILVGRTGADNDKLTFKIAAPDDLWLHAAGVPGAHVVIRNPERRPSAPAATLAEAAGLAVWFSEARSEGGADVIWTRRKHVRRARGGTSGKVVIKRFETIRARAHPPLEGG